jgi:hypothetical protein
MNLKLIGVAIEKKWREPESEITGFIRQLFRSAAAGRRTKSAGRLKRRHRPKMLTVVRAPARRPPPHERL